MTERPCPIFIITSNSRRPTGTPTHRPTTRNMRNSRNGRNNSMRGRSRFNTTRQLPWRNNHQNHRAINTISRLLLTIGGIRGRRRNDLNRGQRMRTTGTITGSRMPRRPHCRHQGRGGNRRHCQGQIRQLPRPKRENSPMRTGRLEGLTVKRTVRLRMRNGNVTPRNGRGTITRTRRPNRAPS